MRFRDADDSSFDLTRDDSDSHSTDQVGTVEVQILLSWFFETASPSEMAWDQRDAA